MLGTERVSQGQVINYGEGAVKQEGKGHNSSFTLSKKKGWNGKGLAMLKEGNNIY